VADASGSIPGRPRSLSRDRGDQQSRETIGLERRTVRSRPEGFESDREIDFRAGLQRDREMGCTEREAATGDGHSIDGGRRVGRVMNAQVYGGTAAGPKDSQVEQRSNFQFHIAVDTVKVQSRLGHRERQALRW